tara:strand:- start:650 stop:1558 length:909 start_codon:yes stop_codon:yes gene_type:complete
MENRRRTGNAYGIDPNTGKHWSEGMPSQPSGIWAGLDGRGDVIRGDGRLMTTSVLPRPKKPFPYGGGLGGLLSRFDPRRMGGGFGGMFGRRRPPPFFGGGQFGGRRPFPGMYRGMPTFMNRMKPPFFDRRQKRPFFGLNRRPPFGGGFRPPFFQQSRPSYNPIPDIDDDAFRQFRQRVGQRPPTAGEASTGIAGPLSQDDYLKNNNFLRQMDGTIFGQSNAPQIPQELIDAQMSSVQQGPPVAGGTSSLYGTPASQEEIDRMQTRMGGLGSIGGMMGGVAQPMGSISNMRIGPKARMMMNRR